MQLQRTRRGDDSDLARREAKEIQRSHWRICQRGPVRVSDLAEALGLRVENRSGLLQRARLEFQKDGALGTSTIAVQASLGQNVKRFAIAHEIGHAVLLRKYPQAAREWAVSRREEFADTFATELLAPEDVRAGTAPVFRALGDPLALLRLASRLGLSPSGLLTVATRERSWFQGLDKIWVRVKYTENAFTGSEAKLRIVSAHYDRERFFIPTNQSLVRFAGSDLWLSSLPPGLIAQHNSTIAVKLRRHERAAPKFLSRQLPARLAAARLQPNATDQAAYLIILAELTSSIS